MKYFNEDKAAEQKLKQSATQSESSLLAPTAEQLKAEATADVLPIMQQIDVLATEQDISLSFLEQLLSMPKNNAVKYLHAKARKAVETVYGDKIFLRGLIEITSYCRNNCNYCGIRRSNKTLERYRMTPETIMACCKEGYSYGMRTFVIQGGEDMWWNDERLGALVSDIRGQYPDCAITLSMGERSRESYQRLFDLGANRYLLRHETADENHYSYLHPSEMSFQNRMQCLQWLKEIGFQVGCGFMVGSPGQTPQTIHKDLQFIRTFRPQMVGIGPFVATQHTPFADQPNGSVETTLRLLSTIRLLHPHVLLPSTTALGSLHPLGRELGVLAGANVLMPNLSPVENREKYNIYDNKICLGDGIDHCSDCLQLRMESTGRRIVVERGDFVG